MEILLCSLEDLWCQFDGGSSESYTSKQAVTEWLFITGNKLEGHWWQTRILHAYLNSIMSQEKIHFQFNSTAIFVAKNKLKNEREKKRIMQKKPTKLLSFNMSKMIWYKSMRLVLHKVPLNRGPFKILWIWKPCIWEVFDLLGNQ